MHILIVDDAKEICLLFALAFRLEGHTTQCAHNGVEAVLMVQQNLFDAIVMDFNMPEMDGIEAVRQVRDLPNGQQVPILMLTGDDEEDGQRAALAAGADTVVKKPILPQVVLRRLAECRL